MVDNALRWGQEGWGGHITVRTEPRWRPTAFIQRLFCIQGDGLIHVNPLLDNSAAQKSMQVAIDFAVAQGGSGVINVLPSWNAFFAKYAVPAEVVCVHTCLCAICLLTCLSPWAQRACWAVGC